MILLLKMRMRMRNEKEGKRESWKRRGKKNFLNIMPAIIMFRSLGSFMRGSTKKKNNV